MVFNKAFDEIDYSDIRNLLDNKVTERQNLEYKSEVWDSNDRGIREMLKDISAMANAFGGYIIIGIKEDENGNPLDELCSIDDNEAENKRDWIISCCISSIEPRIPGLKVDTLKVNSGGSLIKIFIPRSTRRPHMVLKDSYRFYIRHDRQISRMSIEEIREACLRTLNLHKNMCDFLNEQISETSILVGDNTTLMIGLAPLTIGTSIIDINDQSIRDFLQNTPNQRRAGFNLGFTQVRPRPTLKGLIIGGYDWKQVTLLRNGYYEILVRMEDEHHLSRVRDQETYVIKHLPIVEYIVSFFRCANIFKQVTGIEETSIGFLCVFNINKYGFVRALRMGFAPNASGVIKYDKNRLMIEPFEVHDLENSDQMAREVLGRVWNAFGFEAEDVPYFEDGEFRLPV